MLAKTNGRSSMRTRGKHVILTQGLSWQSNHPFPQIAFLLHLQLTDSSLWWVSWFVSSGDGGWQKHQTATEQCLAGIVDTSLRQMVWQIHTLAWPLLVENKCEVSDCWQILALSSLHTRMLLWASKSLMCWLLKCWRHFCSPQLKRDAQNLRNIQIWASGTARSLWEV